MYIYMYIYIHKHTHTPLSLFLFLFLLLSLSLILSRIRNPSFLLSLTHRSVAALPISHWATWVSKHIKFRSLGAKTPHPHTCTHTPTHTHTQIHAHEHTCRNRQAPTHIHTYSHIHRFTRKGTSELVCSYHTPSLCTCAWRQVVVRGESWVTVNPRILAEAFQFILEKQAVHTSLYVQLRETGD